MLFIFVLVVYLFLSLCFSITLSLSLFLSPLFFNHQNSYYLFFCLLLPLPPQIFPPFLLFLSVIQTHTISSSSSFFLSFTHFHFHLILIFFFFLFIFSRVHATLRFAVLVGRSVSWSVGRSVTFLKLWLFKVF